MAALDLTKPVQTRCGWKVELARGGKGISGKYRDGFGNWIWSMWTEEGRYLPEGTHAHLDLVNVPDAAEAAPEPEPDHIAAVAEIMAIADAGFSDWARWGEVEHAARIEAFAHGLRTAALHGYRLVRK